MDFGTFKGTQNDWLFLSKKDRKGDNKFVRTILVASSFCCLSFLLVFGRTTSRRFEPCGFKDSFIAWDNCSISRPQKLDKKRFVKNIDPNAGLSCVGVILGIRVGLGCGPNDWRFIRCQGLIKVLGNRSLWG